MPLAVVTIPNGRWKENCYLVVDGSAHALVIDPGSDAAQIVTAIEKVGLKVLAVLNTHGHYDHMGAVAALQARFGIPFYLHSADEKILKGANLYMKVFEGSEPVTIPRVDRYLDREELPIVIGDFEVQVRFTPATRPAASASASRKCSSPAIRCLKERWAGWTCPAAIKTLCAITHGTGQDQPRYAYLSRPRRAQYHRRRVAIQPTMA